MKRAAGLLLCLVTLWLARPMLQSPPLSSGPAQAGAVKHAQSGVDEQLLPSDPAPRVARSPLALRLSFEASVAWSPLQRLASIDTPPRLDRREALLRVQLRRHVPRLGDEPPWCRAGSAQPHYPII
jgi:hypothetical protein